MPLADRLGLLPDEMGARLTLRDLLRYQQFVEREQKAMEEAEKEAERAARSRGGRGGF